MCLRQITLNCDKSQRLINFIFTKLYNHLFFACLREALQPNHHSSIALVLRFGKALLCLIETLVETRRVELLTSCVQSRRSTN